MLHIFLGGPSGPLPLHKSQGQAQRPSLQSPRVCPSGRSPVRRMACHPARPSPVPCHATPL